MSLSANQTKDLSIRVTISKYRDLADGEIDAVHAQSDNELLAAIGYKAELKRKFSTLQVFGVAYSIMGLLPSQASVMAQALTGGTVSMVWGWFIASFFVLLIGISMAVLASAMPTSGGLYYWTWYYAPEKSRKLISFIIGYCNSFALIAGLCSVDYGFAVEVLSAVYIGYDGDFEITRAKLYGVFVACVFFHILLTCASSHVCSKLQTVSLTCNSLLVVFFLIAVPIGTKINKGGFNDGAFIFGNYSNFSGWSSDGWNFMTNGLMPSVWTIGAFDSCVHMSEEAKNAVRSVPIGIIGSITACGVVGFFIYVCCAACMTTDAESLIDSASGQPLAQLIYDSMGKKWALTFMVLIAFCQFLMGASILTAISRQIWAFSRDNGLPFSKYIKVVNKKLSTPLRAVWFGGISCMVLGLLILINNTAGSTALFTAYISLNYLCWTVPILFANTTGKHKFVKGPFHLGKLTPVIQWIAIAFMVFIIVMVMFPASSTVDRESMNYTVVLSIGVIAFAIVFYFAYANKHFHGPAKNISEMEEYHDGDVIEDGQEIIVINSQTGERVYEGIEQRQDSSDDTQNEKA